MFKKEHYKSASIIANSLCSYISSSTLLLLSDSVCVEKKRGCIPVTYFSRNPFVWFPSSNHPRPSVTSSSSSSSCSCSSYYYSCSSTLFSFVCFLYLFCIFRVSFPQWRRSLVRSVPNLDRSRLFLLALKLECQVYISLPFASLLFWYFSHFSDSPPFVKRLFDVGWFFSFSAVVARFDFSWCDPEYHQETLENLKTSIKSTKKLCAVSFSFSFFFT